MQDMRASAKEQNKSREAEAEYARRELWGNVNGSTPDASDDMGDTILGDVTHPTPIVMAPQPVQSNLWPVVAAAALSALIPTAGLGALGGYLLTRKPPVVQSGFEDSTVEVGLGRIEDYLK